MPVPYVPTRRVPRSALLAGTALLAACALSDALTSPAVENITLSYAGETTLVVGDTVAPAVTAQIGGSAVANPRFRFAIADTTIVALTAGGDSLVARRRGSTAVTAHLLSPVLPDSGPSVTVTLRVVVGAVDVSPGLDTLRSLGDSLSLTATARDVHGQAVPGVPVTWESSDTTIISVSAAGRALARRNGAVTIRAIVDDDTGTAIVVVAQRIARLQISPGALLLDALTAEAQLGAIALDANDSVIGGVGVSWSTLDGSIATVTGAGLVRAIANGTARVRAGTGTVADTLSVTVEQRATQIVISPDPVPGIGALGDQVQLAASATDRFGFGVVTPGKTPSWSTLDPTVTIVTTTGLVTAIGTGSGRIVAVLDAARDTADVTVSNAPVTVDVSPGTATLASINDTLPLSATARNSRGVIVSGLSVTWQALDNAIVQVLPDGRTIAVGTGTGRVVGSISGVADTALITVTNAPFFVNIVPANAVLASIGDSLTPSVDFQNARGAALARSSVTWSSDDPLVVRVTGNGIVIARDTGTTTIRATSPYDTAKRDSIIVTSTNAPASLVLNDVRDTLTALAQALTYTAEVRNARGNLIANPAIAWSTTNSAAAIVSTGVVTAVGFGTASIIAQAGTAADTVVEVVVNPTRLYVDNSVVSAVRFGTVKRPFFRIQDAVNSSDANDTVIVKRGSAPYSESVALRRRVTLLGDSAAFVAGGRNPLLLPLISHDSGAAGILAVTSAPLAIHYFSLRHTLDGPAIDAQGSDVKISDFYVNPPGTVTSRVGRGISVKQSLSSTNLALVRVDSVRGYGIRFEDVSVATIALAQVTTVDSVPGQEPGAGIHILRGSTVTISSSTIRGTAGPQILVDSSPNPSLLSNNLAGRQRLVLIRHSNNISVQNNAFDTRLQGIGNEIPNGGFLNEWAAFEWDSSYQGFVANNTFREQTLIGLSPYNAMRFVGVHNGTPGLYGAQVFNTRIVGGRAGVRLESAAIFLSASRIDSALTSVILGPNDSLTMFNDTLRFATDQRCVDAPSVAFVFLFRSLLDDCTPGGAFAVRVGGGHVQVFETTFRRNRAAVLISGTCSPTAFACFDAEDNTVSGAGFVPRFQFENVNGAFDINGGSGTVIIRRNAITDHAFTAGLYLNGGTLTVDSNLIARNVRGIRLANFTAFTSRHNDLMDNDTAGFHRLVPGATTLTRPYWWGDARGPRGATDPMATGDSIAGSVTVDSVRAAPLYPGTAPATSLRIVRGNGQSALRGTALPQRLTVRALDAAGRPVAGIAVTFTVTGGGGSITVNLGTTDASGLAEATWTMGASPGPNTATASAAGAPSRALSATGT